jgi:hypothetical protein
MDQLDYPEIVAGSVGVTFDKSTNAVAISISMTDHVWPEQPIVRTFTGTGTVDPATGRFSGQIDGALQDAQSGFSGAFYGPGASEMGIVVRGKYQPTGFWVRQFTFAAAGRR